ncbi:MULTISPECIES: SorT family sulfite dehydrogenase catalytic subunit [Marinobacter]|jgi:sulfite dehydrogenase|uniref:SorT family sulfite dehydrogenase catalytic subunit n=1 Tax=Marinobacter TaxID=2742 RepID=UPI0007D93F4B|nr:MULTISPECIES: sulfite oxidase [unclassified Marinobacter]MBL3826545.1 sulfite oxidase [Marinobacter sp. MC3]MBL3894938.1 sulfite oxidase [Marinobacter sp. MW3]OAN88953.1 sulfite oxidase [Marinobacter sp. EhN04]OAN91936.1 sulfite oxidase [Marinobacter sp. EhC06]
MKQETALMRGPNDPGLQNPTRRTLLLGSAGAMAAVSVLGFTPLAKAEEPKSLPDYAAWKERNALIVHSTNTMETQRGAIGNGVITASDRLFVRNNLPAPPASVTDNPDVWEVRIEGVKNPRTLTVGELKAMGITTVASVLQCSGNGRAFFPHGASGTQWSVGAAGCVMWTGVPLADVVEALGGPVDGARYITATGGESLPDGIDPKTIMVERSVPTKALETALLAWEMNDEPLTHTHGGPLRMVVPGYYGVNNVKYVKNLAFTENQTDAKIQASGYRVRDVGVKGSPDQPSMWEMNVKSWVTAPLESGRTGRNMIYGVAFGGTVALEKVDVSVDGGKTWKQARFLGPDLGPYAWRPFVLATDMPAGEHRIVSRATDVRGNTQPEGRIENERGYGHNGWSDHGVTVAIS